VRTIQEIKYTHYIRPVSKNIALWYGWQTVLKL